MSLKLDIIYEDEFIVAVNKPNDLLIYSSYYARNIREESLEESLTTHFNKNCYAIHRLDRKTSGIVLFAKETNFVQPFQQLFIDNLITKTYFAIVRGFCAEKGIIDTPVKHPDTLKYKEAETHFKLINTIELPIAVQPYTHSRYSLIQLKPKTGRTHQLRIHANKISHPIVGDTKYGDRFHNRMFEEEFKCNNLFLHANSLEFKHPNTGKTLNLNATFPSNWEQLFTEFNWKNPTI